MTEIQPALTPEEWAECVSIERGGGDPLTYTILEDPQKAMCWINGNLSDSDPRKITRADVKAAENGSETIALEYGNPDAAEFPHAAKAIASLRTLAAKPAALLPPQ